MVREISWTKNILIFEKCKDDLERALISKVEIFLREMGDMFTFAGKQYRIEVEGNEYFIDLLQYHRRLKCMVAVELKVGVFLPEYVGKMQFYLALLDDKLRLEGENPAIGIILCKDKKKTIVEYALRESNKPIGVASSGYSRFKNSPALCGTRYQGQMEVVS